MLSAEFTEALRRGLHDVGQPLTALECRLYLAGVGEQTAEALQVAVAEAEAECERTIARVRELQELVQGYVEAGR